MNLHSRPETTDLVGEVTVPGGIGFPHKIAEDVGGCRLFRLRGRKVGIIFPGFRIEPGDRTEFLLHPGGEIPHRNRIVGPAVKIFRFVAHADAVDRLRIRILLQMGDQRIQIAANHLLRLRMRDLIPYETGFPVRSLRDLHVRVFIEQPFRAVVRRDQQTHLDVVFPGLLEQ